jgi:hypothetical protein
METNVPFVSSLGSYFTPKDGFRHVIIGTIDGGVHEVFYNPSQGVGRVQLACFDAIRSISAFFTDDDGFQHPIVAAPSGELHEIWYKPGDFHAAGPFATFPGLKDISAFFAEDDHMRIVIVATGEGALHEVFYHPNIGVHISEPPLATFPGIIGIGAFYTADDKFRHVIVATNDGNITEVFYHPSIGVHISEPPLATFSGIIGIAAFYAADDNMRIVIVATQDGGIHEIFYNQQIGAHVTQPALASFPGVVAITAFYTSDNKHRHAIVATQDGNLTEIFYHPSIGVHISEPPLTSFSLLPLSAQYAGPDVPNLSAAALSAIADDSPSGRCIAIAGTPAALYTMGHTGGVWKSVNGAPWSLLVDAPLPGSLDAFNLATNPSNAQHVVAGSQTGVWESTDGGTNWTQTLNPITIGATSPLVGAVTFDEHGRLFVGGDGGVAVRQTFGGPFVFTNVGGFITGLALSENKVWARTASALIVSTNNGATWSAPIDIPNNIPIRPKDRGALAATDDFAYMVATTAGKPPSNCSGDNQLVIYSARGDTWRMQPVISSDLAQTTPNHDGHTCDGTGDDNSLDGRRFIKALRLQAQNISRSIGQGIQLFYGGGQEVWRARSQNNDGTIADWNWVVGTHGPGYSNRDPVHADIWDIGIDVLVGGQTAWIAGDGGVYTAAVNPQYDFVNVAWKPGMVGLHTHQIQDLSLIRMNPVTRSGLVYAIGDSSAWFHQGSALPLPDAPWDVFGGLGDGNWTAADASAPNFAVLARQLTVMGFLRFNAGVQGIRLVNPKATTFIDPALPTRFQFVPSPRTAGTFASADVVMMVDLPLTRSMNGVDVPFAAQPGPATNGAPVLIRNRTFDVNPDINAPNAQGVGWELEVATLPAGTQGFYVSGGRASPVYYAFTSVNGVLSLHVLRAGQWTQIATNLLNSAAWFGPAFVNPYDPSVVYVLTGSAVQVSTDGGINFATDKALTQLVVGANQNPTSIVTQISFSYDNPVKVAVGTTRGDIFFSPGEGNWRDLTGVLPELPVPVTSVGIDCTGIYVGTFGRGVLRITGY